MCFAELSSRGARICLWRGLADAQHVGPLGSVSRGPDGGSDSEARQRPAGSDEFGATSGSDEYARVMQRRGTPEVKTDGDTVVAWSPSRWHRDECISAYAVTPHTTRSSSVIMKKRSFSTSNITRKNRAWHTKPVFAMRQSATRRTTAKALTHHNHGHQAKSINPSRHARAPRSRRRAPEAQDLVIPRVPRPRAARRVAGVREAPLRRDLPAALRPATPTSASPPPPQQQEKRRHARPREARRPAVRAKRRHLVRPLGPEVDAHVHRLHRVPAVARPVRARADEHAADRALRDVLSPSSAHSLTTYI